MSSRRKIGCLEYIKIMLSDGEDPSFGRHSSAFLIVVGTVLLCCGKLEAAGIAYGAAVTNFSLGKVTDK